MGSALRPSSAAVLNPAEQGPPVGWRRWVWWVPLVLLAAIAPVVVSAQVFPKGSPDRDDVAYLSQADALRAGHLTLPAATHDPFFRPFLSGVHDGRVVFKYQPAWPASIALSEAVTGTPRTALGAAGVASVLAVSALAFEVSRRRRVALVAGYLFACSPWFVVQAGTYLAYPASTALLCGATALVLRGVRSGSGRVLVLAGAVMGLGVFHRPFDAVLGLAPVGTWLLIERGRSRALARDLGRIALGAAPFALAFFAYNRAVTGKAFTLAFSLVGPMDRFGFGLRSSLADPGQPGPYDFTIGEAWRTVVAFAASLPDWLPGGLLVVPLVYLGYRALPERRVARLVAAQALVFPVGYFVWWGAANARAYRLHQLLGPLYWFPLLITTVVLAAAGIEALASDPPRWLRRVPSVAVPAVAVVASILVSAVTAGDTVDALRGATRARGREVAALRPGTRGRSLVIAPRHYDGDLFVPIEVPADLDQRHLVAMDPTAGRRRFELLDQHPGRVVRDVLEVHRPSLPLDAGVTTRRRLTIRSNPRVALQISVSGPGTPVVTVDGRRRGAVTASDPGGFVLELAARPAKGALAIRPGRPVDVAVGIDGFELHWLVRVRAGDVQVLVPPTPVRHYHFAGHDPVDVIEDVSPRIRAG